MDSKQHELQPQRKNSLDIAAVLSIFPIFDAFQRYLDPMDLFMLQRTTKAFSELIDTLRSTVQVWDINAYLQRFVSNPIKLRSVMARHDALIVDRVALQFFDGSKEETPLSILVEGNKEYGGMKEIWKLLEGEGYKSIQIMITRDSLAQILREPLYDALTRQCVNGRSSDVVVVSTRISPIIAVGAIFYSTHASNVITWNAAFSLFPALTFNKKKSYFLDNRCQGIGLHEERTSFQYVPEDELTKSLQVEAPRRINDSFTWRIDLNTDGVERGLSVSFFDHSFFQLQSVPSNGRLRLTLAINYLCHCALKHAYAIRPKCHQDMKDSFWETQLQKLDVIARKQCLELSEKDLEVGKG